MKNFRDRELGVLLFQISTNKTPGQRSVRPRLFPRDLKYAPLVYHLNRTQKRADYARINALINNISRAYLVHLRAGPAECAARYVMQR